MAWKERNRRIFQDKTKDMEVIWKRVVNSTRETILVEEWDAEDWKVNQTEAPILKMLNLNYEMVHNKKINRVSMRAQSSDKFAYPRDNFIKLNFDERRRGTQAMPDSEVSFVIARRL